MFIRKKTKLTFLDVVIALLILSLVLYILYRINVGLHYKWNWKVIPQYLLRYDSDGQGWIPGLLLEGLLTTLRLSLWGTVLAVLFGGIMGLCRVSHGLFYRLVGRTYVELIRNMPPLILVFIFYFFVSDQIMPLLGIDRFVRSSSESVQWIFEVLFAPAARISGFLSALVALAIFEGAYIAEIVRAGIQSIDKGQWEASYALGLSRWQQMSHVILPQTVQRILPPMAGQFISLIKDSSIVSVISIQELTFQGMELMAATYLTFEIWITVTILYLTLTLTCSLAVERLEILMARSQR